ncbi:MAG: hypothetical protein AAGI54_10145 [Planctomycetota bacterium]
MMQQTRKSWLFKVNRWSLAATISLIPCMAAVSIAAVWRWWDPVAIKLFASTFVLFVGALLMHAIAGSIPRSRLSP